VVLMVCVAGIWTILGSNVQVADMVSYYYILNCGVNAWIFASPLELSGNVEYDALANLIAGTTGAGSGLIQGRLLCVAVAPLKLSRGPLLSFWLSEGVIPRVCTWLRPSEKETRSNNMKAQMF